MLDLGLTAWQRGQLHQQLAHSHSLRTRVQVLNMQHERLAELTDYLDDGQVNVDADAEVTRSLSMSFLDLRGAVDFDSDSPADGALYANRLLRVAYEIRVPDLAEWVSVPIFTGPVTKLDRAGKYVNVEAQGKESLSLGGGQGAAWQPMTIKKGTNKVTAIRRLMRERGGEHRFNLDDLPGKLPRDVSVGREGSAWQVAKRIAASMNRHLFYNGRGMLVLRRYPGNPVYTFTDGTGGTILTEPQVAFSVDDVRNAVWVKGGKPKAKKDEDNPKKEPERGVQAFHTAPRSHPLSPWRLGRDDYPRYMLHVVENDHIRSKKAAQEVAERVLAAKLRQLVEVTFDALPHPALEPEDLVRIGPLGLVMRMGQFALPLKHEGVMSVGHIRRVSVSRRRRNRR